MTDSVPFTAMSVLAMRTKQDVIVSVTQYSEDYFSVNGTTFACC
jgi:hypothetical protein